MDEKLQEYRNHLVLAEQKAQEDYDKNIIALSGGGLGISFAFIEKVIGTDHITYPELLFTSWLSWAISILFVLISYFTSHLALRRAINQVDAGTIYDQPAGGCMNKITKICNAAGGILFIVGVILMALFVFQNIGGQNGG
ncbi:hypothetical protein ACFL1Z_02905 [Thermodesulfobacteriota bacterium]